MRRYRSVNSKRLRIFVVEDHPDVRDLFTSFLPTLGHWVESAGDASTALERLRQGGFDVLLTDLWQPDAHGWCLLGELRARGDLPPHVVSTGTDVQADVLRLSRTAGCCAHLEQPYRLSEVEQVLEAIGVGEDPSQVNRVLTTVDVLSPLPIATFGDEYLRLLTESRLLCAAVARGIASCSEAVEEARRIYAQCQKRRPS